MLCLPQPSLLAEFGADGRRHLAALGMGRGDGQDGIARARVPGVILGDERVAHLLGSLDDPAQGIEAAKPLFDPAMLDGGDGLLVGALLAENLG